MKNSKNLWAVALMVVTVLWGWSFVAIHQALEFMSASAFNANRFLVGAAVMFVVIMRRYRTLDFRQMKYGLAPGVILFLAFAFQTEGIARTSASNASFITGLAVIFAPVFGFYLLKIRPTGQQAVGAVIAVIGLALLTVKELAIHLGDSLVLVCALFTALHIVVLSKNSKLVDVEMLAFTQVLVVAALSLTWSLSNSDFSTPQTDQAIWAVIVIGIGGTAIGYFVQTKAQVETAPNLIAMILVLEPVFGGIFGYFLGGDRLSVINLVGAALIVSAMVVAEYKSRANGGASDKLLL